MALNYRRYIAGQSVPWQVPTQQRVGITVPVPGYWRMRIGKTDLIVPLGQGVLHPFLCPVIGSALFANGAGACHTYPGEPLIGTPGIRSIHSRQQDQARDPRVGLIADDENRPALSRLAHGMTHHRAHRR